MIGAILEKSLSYDINMERNPEVCFKRSDYGSATVEWLRGEKEMLHQMGNFQGRMFCKYPEKSNLPIEHSKRRVLTLEIQQEYDELGYDPRGVYSMQNQDFSFQTSLLRDGTPYVYLGATTERRIHVIHFLPSPPQVMVGVGSLFMTASQIPHLKRRPL